MRKFDKVFNIIMEELETTDAPIEADETEVVYPPFFDEDYTDPSQIHQPAIRGGGVQKLQAEIAILVEMFKERGFKIITNNQGIHLARPEDYSVAYVGDFEDYSGNIKPAFEKSYKMISLSEVNKHNGTAQNASIDVYFTIFNGREPKFCERTTKDGRTIIAFSPSGMGINKGFKKVKPGMNDEKRTNLVNQTIAAFDAIPIFDVSPYDKNNR